MTMDRNDRENQARERLFQELLLVESYLSQPALALHLEGAGRLGDRLVDAGLLRPEVRDEVYRWADEALQGEADSRCPMRTPSPAGLNGAELLEEVPGRYGPSGEEDVIGRGSQGEVHAVSDTFLGREVAMKATHASEGGPLKGSYARRFVREALVLARLDHPGIVPLYELGQRRDGRLYFTMKRVRGVTLSQAVRACGSLEERLRLVQRFIAVCQAIAYAHSKGVVHRDLKPEHVILGEFGETTVVDWGLAYLLDEAEIADAGDPVRVGAVVGTPRYMSPEQARGEPAGPASDVYSLGCILMELLEGTEPRSWRRAPPELRSIARRAASGRIEDRYRSVESMKEDVQAWLDGREVAAHAYTRWERVRRWGARHRDMVRVALVVMFVGIILGLMADFSRQTSQLRTHQALRDKVYLLMERGDWDRHDVQLLAGTALSRAHDSQLLGAMLMARSGWAPELVVRSLPSETLQQGSCTIGYWDEASNSVLCTDPDTALLRARRVAPGQGWATVTYEDGPDRVGPILSLDQERGRTLFLTNNGVEAVRLEVDNWRLIIPQPTKDRMVALAMLGSDRLATCTQRELTIWQLPDARVVERYDLGFTPRILSGSADGSTVVLGGLKGSVQWWSLLDGRTWSVSAPLRGSTRVAASTEGRWIATARSEAGGEGHEIAVYDARTGQLERGLRGHDSPVVAIAFSPVSSWLLASSAIDGTIRYWDVETGQQLAVTRVPGMPARYGLSFSADGRRLAIVTEDGGLRAWYVPDPIPRDRLVIDSGAIRTARWSGPSDLVSLDTSGHLRFWKGGRADRVVPLTEGPNTALAALAVSTTGEVYVVVPQVAVLKMDAEKGPLRDVWRSADVPTAYVADVSSDGRWLAIGGQGERLLLHDLQDASGAPRVLMEFDVSVTGLRFYGHPPQTLVAAAYDRLVRFDDLEGAVTSQVIQMEGLPGLIDVRSDGVVVVGDGARKLVRVIRLSDGAELATLNGHETWPYAVSFGADPRIAYSGGSDQTVRVWDLREQRELAILRAHRDMVWDLALSPDGRTLASASADGSVGLWNLADLERSPAEIVEEARRLSGQTISDNGTDIIDDPNWIPPSDP